MTPEELTKAIKAGLEDHLSGNIEAHEAHHEYIDMMIKRDERRQELWRKFRLSFVGGLGVALVSGLVWVGSWILEHVQIK